MRGGTPYDEDAVLTDYVRQEPDGMNTSWWRGVGPTHNVFVIESFVDEMAHQSKQDPLEFRRRMLTRNPRALAVLNLAAEKAGWGEKLPAGRGRGISLQFAFGTYLAHILEVEVKADDPEVRLVRSVIAVDCGVTINPDTVLAQMQGGVIFGLGAAMFNKITLTDGAVDQNNFDTYASCASTRFRRSRSIRSTTMKRLAASAKRRRPQPPAPWQTPSLLRPATASGACRWRKPDPSVVTIRFMKAVTRCGGLSSLR